MDMTRPEEAVVVGQDNPSLGLAWALSLSAFLTRMLWAFIPCCS